MGIIWRWIEGVTLICRFFLHYLLFCCCGDIVKSSVFNQSFVRDQIIEGDDVIEKFEAITDYKKNSFGRNTKNSTCTKLRIRTRDEKIFRLYVEENSRLSIFHIRSVGRYFNIFRDKRVEKEVDFFKMMKCIFFDIEYPRIYYCRFQRISRDYLLVMDDISSNRSFQRYCANPSPQSMRLLTRKIGRLHGRWWNDFTRMEEYSSCIGEMMDSRFFRKIENNGEIKSSFVKQAYDIPGFDLYIRQFHRNRVRLSRYFYRKYSNNRTLIYGSRRFSDTFVSQEEERVVFTNFQNLRFGYAVSDFFFLFLTKKRVKAYEEEEEEHDLLIKEHYEVIKEYGGNRFSMTFLEYLEMYDYFLCLSSQLIFFPEEEEDDKEEVVNQELIERWIRLLRSRKIFHKFGKWVKKAMKKKIIKEKIRRRNLVRSTYY